MKSTPIDQEFVAALQANEALLRRVCRLYCQDAEQRQDLFQEIVLQLWRAWPRYEARGAKLSTWLYRIALNVAVSDLRHRTRRPAATGLDEQALELELTSTSRYDADDIDELYQAIGQLSDVEKAFVLLYLEEHSYEEMADILGITQNNVRVKMHRIQEKLRTLFARA